MLTLMAFAAFSALPSQTQSLAASQVSEATGAATPTWVPLGPMAVTSLKFGLVSGRVTALALDPSDTTGNTLFVGTTGGGVWKSQSANATELSTISFTPLTDSVAALSGASDASISIGALAVQPGGTGVILAGTGDPNDNLDSYYGAGILRSTDGGTTWSLIQNVSDVIGGQSGLDYSFIGEGFAGFAFSTANPNLPASSTNPVNPNLVVAAVSQAVEGVLVNAVLDVNPYRVSYEGLYYSQDAGATWHLATITDGNGNDVQGPNDPFVLLDGNAATSVVWNPVRQLFIAAVRYHGYYQSTDGKVFTRMADGNQPGSGLRSLFCPVSASTSSPSNGSTACPIFRGALAVNPYTGDTFAWTVDANNVDQGIFRDQCNINVSGSACSNQTITFGNGVPLTNSATGSTTVTDGDYTLALAAIPYGPGLGYDTVLLAGGDDLYKCSLGVGCDASHWRNITNTNAGFCAGVGEFQHSLAWNLTNPQEVFVGNDSGLWRSADQMGESGAACGVAGNTDAAHFQNLNGSIGSLAEVGSISQVGSTPYTMLAGLGENGTAGVKGTSGVTTDWPEILSGEGGPVAIDPVNPTDWYANNGAGVSIHRCSQSDACTQTDFGSSPVVGNQDVGGDGSAMTAPAPFLLDALDPTQLLVGTCRVWRGSVAGGWSVSSNAISPILDAPASTGSCSTGDAQIRTMAAIKLANGNEIIYVGMYGARNGGARLPGKIWSATLAPGSGTMLTWKNLATSQVTNDNYVFNAYGLDISSIFIDPHDPTGQTFYVTVEGMVSANYPKMRVLYGSTDGGASWLQLTSNLPAAPANSVVVDPLDANTVYVGTDAGVYSTRTAGKCATASSLCWAPYGSGLPGAPVTQLSAAPIGASMPVLVAATYGRGIWEMPLWTAGELLTTSTVSPSTVSFSTPVQTNSTGQQTVTVTNSGSNAMAVSSISITAGAFTENDTCQGTPPVQPSATCAITVTFAPTQVGAQTALMTVYGNLAPNGQTTVALSGSGILPPPVGLTPASISFPATELNVTSAAMQVTVNNATAAAIPYTAAFVGPFAIASNACGSSFPAMTSCSLSVTFTPTTAGPVSGSLTFNDSASNAPQVVTLIGSGLALPTDTLSVSSLSFPDTIDGQSAASQFVTLTNTGGVPLVSISIAASQYFVVTNPSTGGCTKVLAPGSSCSIGVVFSPTTPGPQTGTLTVTGLDTGNNPIASSTVALSGTGLKPPAFGFNPLLLTFAPQQILIASQPLTVTVTNTGGASMANVGFQVNESSANCINTGLPMSCFSIGTTTCNNGTLAPGASCTVQVIFTPAGAGANTATLAFSSSTLGAVAGSIQLSGVGLTPPSLALQPTSVQFVNVNLGNTSGMQPITISNSGGASLNDLQLAVTGDFSYQAGTCTAVLAGGASCAATVTFTPTVVGNRTGTFTASSASRAAAAVQASLSGTGVAASPLHPSATELDFGNVSANAQSAPQTLTVTNSSSTAQTGLSLVLTGPFQLQQNQCGATLAAGATCTTQVVFAPTTTGTQNGTLTLSGSGVTPVVIALTGTGLSPWILQVTPLQWTFPVTIPGQASAVQQFTISDPGSAALSGLNLVVSSQYVLKQNSCTSTLAAGASCTVGVVFFPAADGNFPGSLTVSSTSVATPVTVALSGSGGSPASVALLPASVAFPTTGVGVPSAPVTVKITNSGSTISLTNLVLAVTGNFQLASSTCPVSLAPAASCTANLVFLPLIAGTQPGYLNVTSSTLESAGFIALSGMGFDYSVTATGSASQTVANGQTAKFTLNLTTLNGSQGTFNFSSSECGSLPAYSACSFNPTSETVVSGASNSVVVSIATGQSTTSSRLAAPMGWRLLPLACGVLILPLALRRRKSLLFCLLAALLASGVTSCVSSGSNGGNGGSGGGGGTGVTPAGTYQIPVTLTSNGVTHSITLTLIVD